VRTYEATTPKRQLSATCSLGSAWERPGECLGTAWGQPGEGLGKALRKPKDSRGTTWELPKDCLWACTGSNDQRGSTTQPAYQQALDDALK
jgi:hypothetical protein